MIASDKYNLSLYLTYEFAHYHKVQECINREVLELNGSEELISH